MTDLRNQRRMAATIIKCGVNRVWMDQDRIDEMRLQKLLQKMMLEF